MNSEKRELILIAVAMLWFLLIIVVALWLFFRQWRKERGDKRFGE